MLASSSLASSSRVLLPRSCLAARMVPAPLPFRRHFATSLKARNDEEENPFNRPAPPPLPPKEQREFEQLVKEKANSLQFNPSQGDEVLHPQFRAKPQPDFEGDTNPNTGEVGGPKKDPLTWSGEWTYGGRCYDF